MLIAVLGLLALRCLRGAIQRRENATVPLVATGVACLVGLHAAADFSLQIQAVTLTFMAILGAGIGQSVSSRIDIGD
jgi:branched-subunit amino acid transport protein AzlD